MEEAWKGNSSEVHAIKNGKKKGNIGENLTLNFYNHQRVTGYRCFCNHEENGRILSVQHPSTLYCSVRHTLDVENW